MTAVEWLEEDVQKVMGFSISSQLFEHAKEIEKEQIIDAYNKGEFNQGCNGNAEKYYNETFKSE